jgi:hypothetical protein
MSDTVRVTFLYAMHQQVRYADDDTVYTIMSRTYTERASMGPIITYRLARAGVLYDTAYEPDLLPVEDTP